MDFEPATYWRGNQRITEPYLCSCEATYYHHIKPCKHCEDVLAYLLHQEGMTINEYLAKIE